MPTRSKRPTLAVSTLANLRQPDFAVLISQTAVSGQSPRQAEKSGYHGKGCWLQRPLRLANEGIKTQSGTREGFNPPERSQPNHRKRLCFIALPQFIILRVVSENKSIRNIRPEEPERIRWDGADPTKSLQDIRDVAELDGQKAIDWYWRAKRWKRIPSQSIQALALLLTAAAGLVPIIVQLAKNGGAAKNFDSGPLASLCVGIAAALLGLDKAFGYSSGWTRYVLTATSMTKLLQEFRMDAVALGAAASEPPTAEQRAAMLQRAKEFVSAIHGMVAQETKDWATEFQSNMAQMEKDLKLQLDRLKAQVEQAAKDKEEATRPGAIEMTITNADKTDGFSFEVVLEGQPGTFTDSVSNSKVWTRINTVPGQYKVGVSARCKGSVSTTSTVVDVKPGDTAKPSVTLPIA